MTEIFAMTQGHPLWQKTLAFAQQCSWRAGPYLAGLMRTGGFLPWERVFSAWVDGKIAGFCTLTDKDALPEPCGFSPFIGFVFVESAFRGHRLSEKMIREALRYAGSCGFEQVYLISGEKGLYEKYGFSKIGDSLTIHGTMDQLFVKRT